MSERETKSMAAEPDGEGNLRLVITSEPEVPVDQVPARHRLGLLIRRARVRAEKSLKEVAEIVGVSLVQLGEVERGLIPIGTEHLRAIADLTRADYDELVQAARDFHTAVWEKPGEGIMVVGGTGDARVPHGEMLPEQRFVEYREGWFAGASGRENPGDMSPDWDLGHESGRLAMEDALTKRRSELEMP